MQDPQAFKDAHPAGSDSADDDSDETTEIDEHSNPINTNTDIGDESSTQAEPQLGIMRSKFGEDRGKPLVSTATDTGTSADVASRPSIHDDKVDQNS